MRLNALISKLKKLKEELKKNNLPLNPEVIVDFDENGGYYNLESSSIVHDDDETVFINLQSSNEV